MKVGQHGISTGLDGTEPHQLEQRHPAYLDKKMHPSYIRMLSSNELFLSLIKDISLPVVHPKHSHESIYSSSFKLSCLPAQAWNKHCVRAISNPKCYNVLLI